MKKKGILFLVLMILALTLQTQASSYHNYLPGGKNYLDPENTRLRQDTIETINPFKVLPGQTYTLSLPGTGYLPNIFITVGGLYGQTYLEGAIDHLVDCSATEEKTVCTFTTTSTEEVLFIRVQSSGADKYYNILGIEDFQLEEGSVATIYEPYIAPIIDVEEPVFVDNGTFIMSYLDQTPINTIITNHITVIDEIDGDLSDQIVIETDNYTPNNNVIGEHIVSLSVTDSSGNKALFDLIILIKDEIPPVITGPSVIDVFVDDAPTLSSIIDTHYSITDEYDGALVYQIVNDNYTLNKATLGTYTVLFEAVDSSGNVAQKLVDINVYDHVSPVFTGVDVLESPMSQPLSIQDIVQTQSVSDNYTVLSVNDIIVTEDLYTGNKLITGSYNVTLSVQDSSGNKTEKIIVINVVDDIPPIISGPVQYTDSYTTTLSVADLIELLSISDNFDEVTIDQLLVTTDTLSNRTTQVGVFVVTVELSDSAGNKAIHTIEVLLVDDIPPVIYVDQYIITISSDVTFNSNDALRLLLASNELVAGEYQVDTIYDEYTGHEDEAGTYLYRVSFTSNSGEVVEKEFVIKVIEEASLYSDLVSLRSILVYSVTVMLIGLTIYKAKK